MASALHLKIMRAYFILSLPTIIILTVCCTHVAARKGQFISNLECSYLINYETRDDSSTGCIFSNVFGNTSVIFNILRSYNGFPIDLDSFEILEFIESRISRVPPRLLDHFRNTEILIMTNSSLGSVCDIDGGTKLRELHVSHNHVRNIGEKIFYYNKEIVHVDFSFNDIYTIKLYTFLYTKKLKYLDLSHNKIKSIPNAFFHLNKLEYLDLSYNLLMSIYSTDFYGVNEVRTFNMEGNFIKEVSSTAFIGMSKLGSLSLRNNTLFDIILNFTNPQMFAVDVSMNFLWELEILQSVRKIDASNNKLSSIILGPNVTMQELNLSNNLFKDTSSIRPLKTLKRLYLAGNQLTHVNQRTFYSLTELIELDISDNFLKQMNLNTLQHMHALNSLLIADNDISFVRLPSYETALASLEVIDVTRNTFSCKYLLGLVGELNQRNWRLISREVDAADNVLNIPCYNENGLQECRREMDEMYSNLTEEIQKLHEEIGALYARLENESKEVKVKQLAGRPFFRKG